MKNIAVIGGGASGVLSAIHILKASLKPIVITIYEPAQELGAGLAYSTHSPEHILNVPADKMSFDEANPQDFVDWLRGSAPDVFHQKTYPFVSRLLFRKYLQTRLKEFQGVHTVEWVQEKVLSVNPFGDQWRVETDATAKEFDHCVMATGYKRGMFVPHALTKYPRALEVSPYDGDLSPHDYKDVAIIGTGLTAIDIWRSLRQYKYKGRVHFISRRGQIPQSFTTTLEYSSLQTPLSPRKSPREFMRFVRDLMQATPCDGGSLAQWIRPFVTEIWQQWSRGERKQFLDHIRPYWDSIRHRLPDVVFADLQAEMKSGECTLSKSSQLNIEDHEGRYKLWVSPQKVFDVDKVFIATGARLNLKPFQIDSAYLKDCELKQGFVERVSTLSIVGPPSRTTFWEATAVPEIRRQAQALTAFLR